MKTLGYWSITYIFGVRNVNWKIIIHHYSHISLWLESIEAKRLFEKQIDTKEIDESTGTAEDFNTLYYRQIQEADQ